MSPLAFIGIIAVAIVLLVLLTVRFKIHPFHDAFPGSCSDRRYDRT